MKELTEESCRGRVGQNRQKQPSFELLREGTDLSLHLDHSRS